MKPPTWGYSVGEDNIISGAPLAEYVTFADYRIWKGNGRDLIRQIVHRALTRRKTCLHYLNAHTFNLASKDQQFGQILRQCQILYADGISVVLAARLSGQYLPCRLTAADYFPDFCHAAARAGLRLFILAGKDSVAQKAGEFFQQHEPDLEIVGTADGYFQQDAQGSGVADLIERINASNADVLLVGMGSPRQEQFVAKYREQLEPTVIWTVGALMDYYAGREPLCPRWLGRLGFEWLYRLIVDPKGKWQRYLIGNPSFLAVAVAKALRQRISGTTGV